MPEQETLERAHEDKEEGKSASTQAGEFVREEMHHIREGKHGAANAKQAIAIGLSKARRAGVDLPPPRSGKTSTRTRKQAERDTEKAQTSRGARPSATRSRAITNALKREGHSAASRANLAQHARTAAKKRTSTSRIKSAKAAAQTRKRTTGR